MTTNIISIPWKDSVWFFDIDDTLIDTASSSILASEGIKNVFNEAFNTQIGCRIQNEFNKSYTLMYQGYRVKEEKDWEKVIGGKQAYEQLNKKVADYQKNVIDRCGHYKKWSREVFIKIAADNLKINVSPTLIKTAADAYWIMVAQKSKPFPGTIKLIQEIKKHKRPIFLATSSDARLIMKDNKEFMYDPKYSEKLKKQRIELLRKKGIDFDEVSIGDPGDKPNLDFFEKGIKRAETFLKTSFDLKNAIMIGDSFAGDLQTPKEKLGFGLVVLFEKGKEKSEIIDYNQVNTGNLENILNYLI